MQDNNDSGSSELRAVARDVLRMGKQWAHSAQEWFDHRRQDMNNRHRGERDYESDYERDARLRQERSMGTQSDHGRSAFRTPYAGQGEQGYRSSERGRSDHDIQSDYSGGGYDQLDTGNYGQSGQRYMGDAREQSDYLERGYGAGSGAGRYAGNQDYSARNEFRGGRSASEREYGQRQSGQYGRDSGGAFQAGTPYGQHGAGAEYGQQPRSRVGPQENRPRVQAYDSERSRPYGQVHGSSGLGAQSEGSGSFGADNPGYGSGMGYRGLGPQNYKRSDERIREDINERLTDADDVDARNLSVEVSNGIATLTGSVAQRWMKHRAEDLVENCGGVRDVHNQIQVGSGSAQPMGATPSMGTSSAGSSTARNSTGPGSPQGTTNG